MPSNALDIQLQRRRQVANIYHSGLRDAAKIANRIGSDYRTVLRDLKAIRSNLQTRKRDEKAHNLLRETAAEGLLADIAELNEIIDQLRMSSPEIKALDLSRLFKQKISARRQFAELYGLIKSAGVNIDFGTPDPDAEATVSEADEVDEQDLNVVGKALFE